MTEDYYQENHNDDLIYDSYDYLNTAYPTKWTYDNFNVIIAVKFRTSTKVYRYFTSELQFKKGEILLIHACSKDSQVKVIGYCNMPGMASRKLNFIN